MFVDQVLVLEIYSSLVYRFYVVGEVPGTAPLVDTWRLLTMQIAQLRGLVKT